jgi:hypothetical protein
MHSTEALASVGRVLNPNNGLAWHVVNEDLMIFVVFIKVRKYKDFNIHSKDCVCTHCVFVVF